MTLQEINEGFRAQVGSQVRLPDHERDARTGCREIGSLYKHKRACHLSVECSPLFWSLQVAEMTSREAFCRREIVTFGTEVCDLECEISIP